MLIRISKTIRACIVSIDENFATTTMNEREKVRARQTEPNSVV